MPATCRFGHFYARCGTASCGVCQYCAMPFCPSHGGIGPEHEQVCFRPVCQSKKADLVVHFAFRERAELRNRHGQCGIEGCLAERWGQCSKCAALFCEQHLFDRTETVRQGMARLTRPASFCEHCLQRRKLWSRT